MWTDQRTTKEMKEIADKWTGYTCLLNGEKAVIKGRLLKFPIVASIESDLTIEYSWSTVDRIMKRDRKFST